MIPRVRRAAVLLTLLGPVVVCLPASSNGGWLRRHVYDFPAESYFPLLSENIGIVEISEKVEASSRRPIWSLVRIEPVTLKYEVSSSRQGKVLLVAIEPFVVRDSRQISPVVPTESISNIDVPCRSSARICYHWPNDESLQRSSRGFPNKLRHFHQEICALRPNLPVFRKLDAVTGSIGGTDRGHCLGDADKGQNYGSYQQTTREHGLRRSQPPSPITGAGAMCALVGLFWVIVIGKCVALLSLKGRCLSAIGMSLIGWLCSQLSLLMLWSGLPWVWFR